MIILQMITRKNRSAGAATGTARRRTVSPLSSRAARGCTATDVGGYDRGVCLLVAIVLAVALLLFVPPLLP